MKCRKENQVEQIQKGLSEQINLDHSWEDTGHCREFSGPGTCIWKMRKDLFTTVESEQLPHPRGTLILTVPSQSRNASVC